MGLSRRFLNLIAADYAIGARLLLRIDLTRHQLFHPTQTPPAHGHGCGPAAGEGNAGIDQRMEGIRLPRPSFSFKAGISEAVELKWYIGCFPLADGKMLFTDSTLRAFLFDANTRHVTAMPNLHKHKVRPAPLFVPGAGGVGGSLFLMEEYPKPEPRRRGQLSHQFEAFVYRETSMTSPSSSGSWHHHLLPPPPYVHDPSYWNLRNKITSYAVLGGGSHICISVEGVGTYCMDTTSHEWYQLGEWKLPFKGKVEYVPELKLWFGLSAETQRFAAADLSTMNSQSQPQLVGEWKELDLPEEWVDMQRTQIVNLGSGRFCIARFMATTVTNGKELGDVPIDRNFIVLTGVEVLPLVRNGNREDRKVELQMVSHKSRRINDIATETLF
ncbi:hypothetical protein ACP70R_005384 [Stipagrostis hirtigluma subsp. patula]